MIVAEVAASAVHLGPGTQRVRTRCLARRGMLHSECEAFEHVRLSPGGCFALTGRDGTEAAWYVLRGLVARPDVAGRRPATLVAGELLLAAHGERIHLHGGPLGADLLCLTVVPDRLADRLPPRRPDLR